MFSVPTLLPQTLLCPHPQTLHHLMILRIRRRLITHHNCLPIQQGPLPLKAQVLQARYILLPIPVVVLEEDVDASRVVPFRTVERHFDDGVASRKGQCLSWGVVGRAGEIEAGTVAVEVDGEGAGGGVGGAEKEGEEFGGAGEAGRGVSGILGGGFTCWQGKGKDGK